MPPGFAGENPEGVIERAPTTLEVESRAVGFRKTARRKADGLVSAIREASIDRSDGAQRFHGFLEERLHP